VLLLSLAEASEGSLDLGLRGGEGLLGAGLQILDEINLAGDILHVLRGGIGSFQCDAVESSVFMNLLCERSDGPLELLHGLQSVATGLLRGGDHLLRGGEGTRRVLRFGERA